MGLLTDSSVALATDSSSTTTLQTSGKARSTSLPTAIFPSSSTQITGSDAQITSSATVISSSFYSDLQILTDTSSIAALASSGSISNSKVTTSGSSDSSNNGGLDEDTSGESSSSSSVASVSSNQKSDSSDSSSLVHDHTSKFKWKLMAIPLMLVLPLVL